MKIMAIDFGDAHTGIALSDPTLTICGQTTIIHSLRADLVAERIQELAKEHDIHSVAFPAISTGTYGYPKQAAAVVALKTVSMWLSDNPDYGMAVVMSCMDQEMRQYYQNVIDVFAPKDSKNHLAH